MQKTVAHAFKAIESDLSGGASFLARVVLLFGEERYLVDHYERVLRARYVSPGAELIDYSRVDWDAKNVSGTVSDIAAACDTLPMTSGLRVVTVSVTEGDDKSLGYADVKPLATYVKSVPETAMLIITSVSIPKNSALYKAVTSNGKAYEFGRLSRPDLTAFIRGRFKRVGVTAPPDVVSEIVGVSGYLDREPRSDLFRLGSDVANIAAYALGGECVSARREDAPAADGAGIPVAITLADVAACMGASMETDVFAMLDAVSAGRKGDSIELLRNITGRGGNAFGLIALLTSQFEIMLGYRELKDRRVPKSDMLRMLGLKSEFRLKKAAGFADRYSTTRIAELLHRLYRVDRDIKSGLYGERLALTMFVAEM
jgi:DNA polymerase-3 subunit delta